MAVKFRRIEDQGPSVAQIQARQDTRSRRFRLLPKVLLLFLALGVCYGGYRYYVSRFLTSQVLVEVSTYDVKAPVTGFLNWMLPAEKTEVARDEPIFRIDISQVEMERAAGEAEKARIEVAEAKADLKEVGENRRSLVAGLAAEEDELQLKNRFAADGLDRARVRLEKAKRILAAREIDLANAGKLKRLDAITESDYQASERLCAVAKADCDEAVLYVKSAAQELATSAAYLETFRQKKEGSRQEADAKIEAAEARLLKAAHNEESRRSENRAMEPVIVSAPMAGTILDRYVRANQAVEKGQELMTIYDPASKAVCAYVPPRSSVRLKPGDEVRLYLTGLEGVVPATVGKGHEQVVKLPEMLRVPEREQELYVVRMDVSVSPDVLSRLVPGQTGVAVIRMEKLWPGSTP